MEELAALADAAGRGRLCDQAFSVLLAAVGLLFEVVDLEKALNSVGDMPVGCAVQLFLHPEVAVETDLQQTAAGECPRFFPVI